MINRKQTAILLSTFAFLAAFGASPAAADPPQLEGSWQVISVLDGSTNEVPSLFTYNRDGGLVATGPTVSDSTAHGAWERSGPRTYSSTQVSFLYGGTGQVVATVHLNATVTVSLDGQTYDADFDGEIRPVSGPVTTISGTAVGSRINVE